MGKMNYVEMNSLCAKINESCVKKCGKKGIRCKHMA